MDSSNNNPETPSSQKIFCKQPITCPWITSQPYPSAQNKNRTCEVSVNNSLPNVPVPMESRTINDKTCPSLQHSSSQFFYFLRLMQLFPETHPATLHTVLNLCKNDFFCAVDKLLYAKRCKVLFNRSKNVYKRCSTTNRSHPYCDHTTVKSANQQQKVKPSETTTIKDAVNVKEYVDIAKIQNVLIDNLDGSNEHKNDNTILSDAASKGDSNNSAESKPQTNKQIVNSPKEVLCGNYMEESNREKENIN